jgi:hypothetical protein
MPECGHYQTEVERERERERERWIYRDRGRIRTDGAVRVGQQDKIHVIHTDDQR